MYTLRTIGGARTAAMSSLNLQCWCQRTKFGATEKKALLLQLELSFPRSPTLCHRLPPLQHSLPHLPHDPIAVLPPSATPTLFSRPPHRQPFLRPTRSDSFGVVTLIACLVFFSPSPDLPWVTKTKPRPVQHVIQHTALWKLYRHGLAFRLPCVFFFICCTVSLGMTAHVQAHVANDIQFADLKETINPQVGFTIQAHLSRK